MKIMDKSITRIRGFDLIPLTYPIVKHFHPPHGFMFTPTRMGFDSTQGFDSSLFYPSLGVLRHIFW